MTNTKHTPGPWHLKNDGTEIHDRDMKRDQSGVWTGERPNLVATIEFCPNPITQDGEDTRLANARLIAASPVLLAACQTAFDALESEAAKNPDGPQAKALAQLRTAIYTAIPE